MAPERGMQECTSLSYNHAHGLTFTITSMLIVPPINIIFWSKAVAVGKMFITVSASASVPTKQVFCSLVVEHQD